MLTRFICYNRWDCHVDLEKVTPAPTPLLNQGASSNTGSCQVTFKQNSCQVISGLTMGSCFLPPFQTSCSGLPPGCGSCVDECIQKGHGYGESFGSSVVSTSGIYIVYIKV